MATRTISNAGGNYNAVGTWVEGIVPTNADDVVATASSGNLVVNVTSVAKTADFTNYVSTVSGTSQWTISGSFKLVAGMGFTYSGSFIINAAATITSAGKTFAGNFTFGASTITIADAFIVTGSIIYTNPTITLNANVQAGSLTGGNSSSVWNGSFTVSILGNFTVATSAGNRLTGTASFNLTSSNPCTLVCGVSGSGVGGLNCNLTVNKIGGTVTLGSSFVFGGVSGTKTFTWTNGTLVSTGSTLELLDSPILDLNSVIFNNLRPVTASQTITLNSPLIGTGTLTIGNNTTFAGTSYWTTGTLTNTVINTILTLAATKNYTINTAIVITGTAAAHISIVSSSGGSQAILKLSQGATQDIGFVTATDIDSSLGQTIWDYKGTLSNATNWRALPTQPPSVGYASII